MQDEKIRDESTAAWPAMPHNVEAEALLLGGLMSGEVNWLIDQAAELITGSSFYEPVHGRIFDAIVRQHSLGKSASPVFIKGYLEGDEALERLGGNGYLARLTSDMACLVSPKDFVKQIADLEQRRSLMAAMRDGYVRAGDLNEDLRTVVGQVDTSLDAGGDDSLIESDLGECFDAFEQDMETEYFGVKCEIIPSMDKLLGGLERKSLTILAGRPGMGKTGVAMNFARGAAEAGHGVSFISCEMSREQLIGRMISEASFDDETNRIPYSAVQRKSLTPWERERYHDIRKDLQSLPMRVVDAANLAIGRLERIIRRQKRYFAAKVASLDLVVVDYLQLLGHEDRRKDRFAQISDISMRLKGIAKTNNLAVLALSQLSRTIETRPDKRPMLSDLRESGQIEQDADAVLFLLREEYYLRKVEPRDDPEKHAEWEDKMDRVRGLIELIAAKRRNGAEGSEMARFYGPYQAVRG